MRIIENAPIYTIKVKFAMQGKFGVSKIFINEKKIHHVLFSTFPNAALMKQHAPKLSSRDQVPNAASQFFSLRYYYQSLSIDQKLTYSFSFCVVCLFLSFIRKFDF